MFEGVAFKELSSWLFDPAGLTPHGFCLLWDPALIWIHAGADITIGLAYFSIPLALGVIARRRHDLVFKPVFWLFSSFILLCGAGHWLDLLTLWVPVYGIEGAVKAVTAIVSIVTAVGLWHILPGVLDVNEALRTDITLGKKNEAVLRTARDASDAAARAKSEFLATMSHEIRSPMSGLVGVVELLRETRLDPEQARMAGMVHSSALVLLGVLNDILDFSKMENSALSIVLEPLCLRDLVTDLLQPHLLEAAGKGVEMTLRFGPGLPEHVEMDPLRLRQILNNLLSNAVKFTAAGAIALSLDIERQLETGRSLESSRAGIPPGLRFAVRDTGIGMSAQVMDRLFEPFMQADGSTTRDFGGTGLGLCISRRLAGLLGGTLTAASRAREGSVFTLRLPLVVAAAPAPARVSKALPLASSPAAAPRILVADDDPTNRWLTHRQLELLGLRVDLAENGEAAFEMLQTAAYDLLLTDCHMPRMDGVALTRAVRTSGDPVLQALPIIGLTADVTVAQSDRCRDAGMMEVAIKPLNRDRLSELLHRHLPRTSVSPAPHQPAAATAPARGVVLFDGETYRDLFAPGDPEGEAWLAEYLETSERLHEELNRLFASGEAATRRDAVAATAHRLVGSSLSVGAAWIGEEARRMEHAAAAEDLPLLCGRLVALGEAMVETRQAMTAFMGAVRAEAAT